MKRKLILAMICTLLLGLTACSNNSEDKKSSAEGTTKEVSSDVTSQNDSESDNKVKTPDNDAVITVGMTWAIKAVEPTKGGNPWALTSCGISESVFRQNSKGELVSRFVKKLKHTDDLTWEITLNEDVKFSDGSPVDAAAFATSLNQVMAENPLSNATAGKIKFTPRGDYTVTAETERATKVLNSVLCEWTNIVFKDGGDGNYVFTGPYVIDKLDSGISLNLSPNKHYPYAEKRSQLFLKAFPDVSAMKLAIESEQIDMAFTVTPEVAEMLKEDGVTVKKIDAGYQYFAPVNLKGILADAKLRQAIDLALDRNAYLAALGSGRLPTGTFASYNPFAGRVAVKTDLEAAKKLLEEAGYTYNDQNKLEKDDKAVKFKLVTYPSRPDLSVIMQIMVTQLQDLGIESSTEIVDNIDEELKKGNFDIALYAQHTSPTGNPSFFLNQFFRTGGPKNMMSYSSDDLDKILDKMSNVGLGQEMNKLAVEAQNQLQKDLPILLLDDPEWFIAVSKRLENYQPYCGDYYIINDQLFNINK